MTRKKRPSVKRHSEARELERISKLFRTLERDKSLPTFGEHFVFCLLSGIAERVNLKKLYPKTYRKLSLALKRHAALVLATKQ